MEWISILLSTASTRVLVNGVPGPTILYTCGLRQGDPLSLMIFTIFIDVLNSLIQRAVEQGFLQRLINRHAASSVSLYANDVVIFCHPDAHDIHTIRGLLQTFGSACGLRTNFAKCLATPIRCTDEHLATINSEMACLGDQFPVKYHAPPSIRKSSTNDLMPLVDKLEKKLST